MIDYTHNQTSAASTWVINHNMNAYPNVDVVVDYNGGREVVQPLRIEYTTANQLRVVFSTSWTGSAVLTGKYKFVLNTGSQDATP